MTVDICLEEIGMTNDLKTKKKLTKYFLWGVMVVGSTQLNVTGLIFCIWGTEMGNYYHGGTAHVKEKTKLTRPSSGRNDGTREISMTSARIYSHMKEPDYRKSYKSSFERNQLFIPFYIFFIFIIINIQ